MISMQQRLSTSEPSQHLFEDMGKSRKLSSIRSVAGSSAGWLLSASSPADEGTDFKSEVNVCDNTFQSITPHPPRYQK